MSRSASIRQRVTVTLPAQDWLFILGLLYPHSARGESRALDDLYAQVQGALT